MLFDKTAKIELLVYTKIDSKFVSKFFYEINVVCRVKIIPH